jgi:hypothetical protein
MEKTKKCGPNKISEAFYFPFSSFMEIRLRFENFSTYIKFYCKYFARLESSREKNILKEMRIE